LQQLLQALLTSFVQQVLAEASLKQAVVVTDVQPMEQLLVVNTNNSKKIT
jgi:hypothetical protein